MAGTGTTGDRQRRSVMESTFYSGGQQHRWLFAQHGASSEELMSTFRNIHRQLFHDTFINPRGASPEDNQCQYEALEEIATILKDRGCLPEEFSEYALNVDELPWKKSLISP